MFFWFILIWIGPLAVSSQNSSISSCYDAKRNPQRCVPQMVSVSENVPVESTNTCGNPRALYFLQTTNENNRREAAMCDADPEIPGYSHHPKYLTDGSNQTWWQSQTMAELNSTTVNLTIHFPKAFIVHHVTLVFMSLRAESFVILKKRNQTSDWTPWQYYSSSCLKTYGIPPDQPVTPAKQTEPQCSSNSTDIVPLTGGVVVFEVIKQSFAEDYFEENENLQEWTTATAVRISLNRMNTYGDEILKAERVLRSYYYAIQHLRIGARCHCNGHAPSCGTQNGKTRCDCEHNTAGEDCERCREGYMDREWRAATSTEANECLPCNCSGLSKKCLFDKTLFQITGSGSKCLDCEGNTRGNNCELCKENHYRLPKQKYCTDCGCDPAGSKSSQCDQKSGQCECKDGVEGRRCDRCRIGFFDFGSYGCRKCNCSAAGSVDSKCRSDGKCVCKQNVEGDRCDICKFGTFGLKAENPLGCSECFCWGHSSQCSENRNFYSHNITSTFHSGTEGWTAKTAKYPVGIEWSAETKSVTVRQTHQEAIFFHSPREFRTNLASAFGRFLEFDYFSETKSPSLPDLVKIRSGDGRSISFWLRSAISGKQRIRILLHPDAGWTPRYSVFKFRSLLANVSDLSIRGTFGLNGFGLISNVRLESADRGFSGVRANWIESCNCGTEYFGSSCENCFFGYRRAVPYGGPEEKCVPCECNGHAEECDAESGVCDCQHNTVGENCQHCAVGFYGNALNGTATDCQSCDCPYNGDCVVHKGQIHCLECPEGHTGLKCLECIDGFYGNPANGKMCKKCNCNDNTDPNDIGGCDKQTGECRRCIHNTTGRHCDRCLDGFYGNISIRGDCRSCDCSLLGSVLFGNVGLCDQTSGQCKCLPNVSGRKCDQCLDGYFNMTKDWGCSKCDCDLLGTLNGKCHIQSGQCECKIGVTGKRCDQCEPQFFGFTAEGCTECQCNDLGSQSQKCDNSTGQCLCHEHVSGKKCDRCDENFYNFEEGCPQCDGCYSLIQSRRNRIAYNADIARQRLDRLKLNPVNISDPQFSAQIQTISNQLIDLKRNISNTDQNVGTKIRNSLESLKAAGKQIQIQKAELNKQITVVENKHKEFRSQNQNATEILNQTFKEIESRYQPLLSTAINTQRPTATNPKIGNMEIMAQEAEHIWKQSFGRILRVQDLSDLVESTLREMEKETNQTIYGKSESISVQKLRQRVNATAFSIQSVFQFGQKIEAEANSALQNVLSVLNGAESTNLTRLSGQHKKHKSKSEQIKRQIERLNLTNNLAAFQTNITAAKTKISQTELKFKKAQRKSKQRRESLSSYQKRAQKALEDSLKVGNKAKETLQIVSEFVSVPAKSRKQIHEELGTINITGTILRNFNSAQTSLKADLSNLKSKAENVQTQAVETKQKATIQLNDTKAIRENLREQKENKEKLKTQLDSLLDNLAETEQKNKDLEDRIQKDEKEVKQKFNEAKHSQITASNMKEQLSEFDSQLEGIALELKSFVSADSDDLDFLEKKINEAEAILRENQISEQIKADELERNRRQRTLLKAEMAELQTQMEALQLIAESLPDKCFNNIGIEKE